MRATNRKDTSTREFLVATELIRHVQNVPRRTFLLSSFLVLVLACSFGCAPSSSPGDDKQSESAANELPEITDETIRQAINNAYIRQIPEENGAADPINWNFDDSEPKKFTVVEKQVEGERATIIIDIKTQSAPGSRSPKYLAGQIRTKWELQTGWALRKWEIVETENVSMKYRNLPKPPGQNSNR